MKVIVAVKQVQVLGDEVEFTGDGLDVDPDYLDRTLNEWDSFATEEALQLRERLGGEVVVVTCGPRPRTRKRARRPQALNPSPARGHPAS